MLKSMAVVYLPILARSCLMTWRLYEPSSVVDNARCNFVSCWDLTVLCKYVSDIVARVHTLQYSLQILLMGDICYRFLCILYVHFYTLVLLHGYVHLCLHIQSIAWKMLPSNISRVIPGFFSLHMYP